LRGLASGVLNIGPIWRSRREVQSARTASVWNIAAALTWSPDVFLTRRPIIREIRAPQPQPLKPQKAT
jgi:hypothetical protein